jgi:hypothetical protein
MRDQFGRLPYSIALWIADGIAVRPYSIAEWFPGGATLSTRGIGQGESRWEFVGQLRHNHAIVGRRLVNGNSEAIATRQGYPYIN